MKRDAIAYLILFANIILLVAGQTLFKLSLQKTGGLNWMKVASSLPIISGLGLYVIASGLWFVVLSRLPLSIAYPLQSIAYVFAIFVAWGVFGETITLTRWAGLAIILLGVYVITR